MFYLDLITFKGGFLISYIVLKYLSTEGGEGERDQLSGFHPRPSAGGATVSWSNQSLGTAALTEVRLIYNICMEKSYYLSI